MAIRIPNIGPVSSGPAPQGQSLGSAVSAGLSLGAVARGMGVASQELEEHDQKIQAVQNAADLTDFKTRVKTAYAERQASFADDHDHLTYLEKWEKDIESLRKSLGEGQYSNDVLEKANLFLKDFEGDSRIGVASAAQRKALERRDQAFKNGMTQIEMGYDPANPEQSTSFFRDLLDDQGFSPEAREAAEMQFENFTRQRDMLAKVEDDPDSFLKRDKPRGMPSAEWENYQTKARRVVAVRAREQSDLVLDAIYSGRLTDPSQVEALAPDLGAYAQQRLKDALADRGDEELKRMMNTPEFRNQVAGEVAELIDGYDPEGGSRDYEYVEIRNKIEMLPAGPLKDEYERELKGIREGKEREIKDVRDWAFAQVDEAYKAGTLTGGEPEKPKGRSLGSYLESGILEDADTLRKFGFQEEHAEAIAEAAKAESQAALDEDESYKGPSSVDLFRRHYFDGGAAVDDFSYKLREVFEAINANKGPTHMVIDPADQWEFERNSSDHTTRNQRAYGRARAEVAEFLRLNPNPDMEKASSFLEEIQIDIEAGETDSGFEPRPGDRGSIGPAGDRSVTSFKPVFSSYSERQQIAKAGGSSILLDSNWGKGDGVTSPLVVIPDGATSEQREAAEKYASAMAELQKEVSGRVLKPRVVTRSKNGRGRSNAIHTEGFAITDQKMVDFIKSEEGLNRYRSILDSTFGRLKGASFFLPHEPGDPGAVNGNDSEVSLAKKIISR